MTWTEAADQLGYSPDVVVSGVLSGKLDAARVARRKGRSTLYLFNPEQLKRYSRQIATALDRDVVCERLGVDRKQVSQFARANLLTKVGLCPPYSYAAIDVEQLEALAARLPLPTSNAGWLPADRAAQLARVPLTLVTDGVIAGNVMAARGPEAKRVLGLYVRAADAFRLRSTRSASARGVTAEVLAAEVDYGKRSLARWAQEGLIECTRTSRGQPRMTIGAVEVFRRN